MPGIAAPFFVWSEKYESMSQVNGSPIEREDSSPAPGNLNATAVSGTQIDLSWTDNLNNESGFKIERCTGGNCTKFQQIAAVGADGTSFSNSGLRKSTTYRYSVRAYNAAGNSGYSNIFSATTSR